METYQYELKNWLDTRFFTLDSIIKITFILHNHRLDEKQNINCITVTKTTITLFILLEPGKYPPVNLVFQICLIHHIKIIK